MINETGSLDFCNANDANIPVDIWLSFDKGTNKWRLSANNYMPRKGALGGESAYEAWCENREELTELIRTHILPLYQAAVKQLTHMCEPSQKERSLYYWNLFDQ